jgi:hypothetical protein
VKGEGKKDEIGQQVDLTADLGWSVLQLWEACQREGIESIEDYDAMAEEMKMKMKMIKISHSFSHHVGTGYEMALAVSLAGPGRAET